MYSKAEIAYLIKSGYSMSEIMALDGIEPEQKPADPKPADPEPEPKPAEPIIAKDVADNKNVLEAIENLTKAIQAGNIRAGGFPAPEGERTADAILASIINPPGYGTGK